MEILTVPGRYDIVCLPLSIDDVKDIRGTGELYLRLRLQVEGGEHDGKIHFHMVFPCSANEANSQRALDQLKTLGWDGEDFSSGKFNGLGSKKCVGTFEQGKPYKDKPQLNCRYIDDRDNPPLRGQALWASRMQAF